MSTIAIEHLTKTYGALKAVDDVSIAVPSGSVFGLLGPNGAGKTTTFKCMLGLARPTSGGVTFDGAPLTPNSLQRIAYVPERSVLYEWMTAGEHLEMQRRNYARFNRERAAELMTLFSLDARKRVGKMSKGMRTALSVVLAFAIEPEIAILDEPTSGLDPVNQRSVLNLIIDAAARGMTTILSSHQIGQVERAADHIAVLRNGRVALAGAVDDLKAGHKIVEAIFASDSFSIDGFASDPRIGHVERTGRILRLTVHEDSDDVAAAVTALDPLSVRVVDLNLEDIFLNAVGAEPAADVVEGV